MSLMQIRKKSSGLRSNLKVSKSWFCRVSYGWYRTADMRAPTHQVLRKRLIVSMLMGFVDFPIQCLRQSDFFLRLLYCQEARPAQTGEDIQRGTKKGELDEMRKRYIVEKSYTIIESEEYERWNFYKTIVSARKHLRELFPYWRPLHQNQLLDMMKSGALFDYLQCDIKVPEQFRENFANFPPCFKNTNVCSWDNGPLMWDYARKEKLMTQPRWRLYSGLELTKGKIITPLLLFYLELGLLCTKKYRYIAYTPFEWLNNFVFFVVNARR